MISFYCNAVSRVQMISFYCNAVFRGSVFTVMMCLEFR